MTKKLVQVQDFWGNHKMLQIPGLLNIGDTTRIDSFRESVMLSAIKAFKKTYVIQKEKRKYYRFPHCRTQFRKKNENELEIKPISRPYCHLLFIA